jgi:hypothetical protein
MVADILRETPVSPETMLPDLLRAHPEARAVFDRHGLSGCGGRLGPVESIRFFARAHGVDEARLLAELEEAIGAPAVAQAPAESSDVAPAPDVADTIYRRYFIGAIAVVLTAGASWGAYLLWQIGIKGSFFGASLFDINAHGHAQIFGWVGLFIMGFACQAFPRLWHTRLAAPQAAVAAFALMMAGIAVRTVGMTTHDTWSLALPAAMLGGALEIAAIFLFVGQMLMTLGRGDVKAEPYLGFVVMGLFWFAAMAVMSVWHTYNTMHATTFRELVWYVAAYQAPLRDLQIHGLALFMILGVSIRMLPALFDVPPVPNRRGWAALAILTAAVVGEVACFIAYVSTGDHVLAAFLLVPWSMLVLGTGMIVLPWRLWRPFTQPDRSGKFVRAAYAWLFASLLMLLMLPVYQFASGTPFSHAYYGSIRHAITVGFISLMIMGMAAKVVPTLNGVDPRTLSGLWGPFLLVNLGCFLRVTLQTLTDWNHVFFVFVGVSGVLEVSGLAWWGVGLIRIIARGRREAAAPAVPAGTVASHPVRIDPDHRVADVLEWFPETEAVFEQWGFGAVRQPLLRRTLARQVSIAQAASLRGVPLAPLLDSLNAAISPR